MAQYVFALLRALKVAGRVHEFSIFVLEEDVPLFDFLGDAMQVVKVEERFRDPVKNIVWHQRELPNLARRLGQDCLHIPSYRRLLWHRPCPLVATIHDLAPFRVPGKYDWKRMLYGRVVVKWLARRQDEIIAISRNTAEDIERFFQVPAERVTVIHNGIEHERFFPGDRTAAKTVAAERHGLREPFFLYVARLEHPGKNHLRLIAAFEDFKAATRSNWELVFGGSDWHGAEVIHDAIRRSRFGSSIQCLGFVADKDLPELYRAADVFVYPSLYEGFGLPPVEAMACGCPVIASPRGSLGEVLGEAASVIDPDDVHTISRELYVLATDSERRNHLRAAGLAQARKFDWTKAAEQTLEVYARAVRRRK